MNVRHVCASEPVRLVCLHWRVLVKLKWSSCNSRCCAHCVSPGEEHHLPRGEGRRRDPQGTRTQTSSLLMSSTAGVLSHTHRTPLVTGQSGLEADCVLTPNAYTWGWCVCACVCVCVCVGGVIVNAWMEEVLNRFYIATQKFKYA